MIFACKQLVRQAFSDAYCKRTPATNGGGQFQVFDPTKGGGRVIGRGKSAWSAWHDAYKKIK